MASARRTTDHDEIREWVERNGGRPAQVEGTGGMLRIDFGDEDARLEPIEWDRFFDIFDRSGLGFLYDPEGHMNKFIQVSEDETGIGKTEPDERDAPRAASRGARKKSSGRKKSTSSRKKSSSKKSAGGARKKSTTSRKKSTSGGGRKKSTSSRKKSTSKKSSSKKSTSSRKKSSSKKSTSKKSAAKKSSSKKSSSKKSGGRKYGRKAGKKVERAMHEMKRGQLRSGTKGPKVKSRKQAIAIGLSEARREGDKVPRRKSGGRKKKR